VHGPGSTPEPRARVPVAPGNSDLCFEWRGTPADAVSHLEAQGVEVELGPVERTGANGLGTSVYFRDPDGSLLELITYARMTTEEAAERWAKVWARAWPEADVEAIAALYSRDAVFYSHPFRAHQSPREYVEAVFGEQAAADCRFGEPLVVGGRAAVDWWGVITPI